MIPRMPRTEENIPKLFEQLQGELKQLANESKKKYPHIKEASEESIMKLRNTVLTLQTPIYQITNQMLYPIVQGCETKDSRLVKICLGMIQKLISHQVVDNKGARFITDVLWILMEHGIEEVKLLQSAALLLTTNSIVHGDILAKNLVICFRLHFSKDPTISNTAGATVRQLVSLVFERLAAEDEKYNENTYRCSLDELRIPSSTPPKILRPCAADAFLLFQDLIELVNAENPVWLLGLCSMTRTFSLELIDMILVKFPLAFFKERVCALVIKLFSPNVKYKNYMQCSQQQQSAISALDKPYFPMCIRLLRVISTMIHKYHGLLETQCEIFLSFITKFIDSDKPIWQRACALEVLHKISVEPDLVSVICESYDLKGHSTRIFRDLMTSLTCFVNFHFINHSPAAVNVNGVPNPPMFAGNLAPTMGPGISPQPGFFFKGTWLPLVMTYSAGQAKPIFLDMMDKVESPLVPDGYGLSMAYAIMIEIVRSLSIIIDKTPTLGINWYNEGLPHEERHVEGNDTAATDNDTAATDNDTSATDNDMAATDNDTATTDNDTAATDSVTESEEEHEKMLYCQLIESSWMPLLNGFSHFIEASTDEMVTENILKAMQTYVILVGNLDLHLPRDSFIMAICRASLPPNYYVPILGGNCQKQESSAHFSVSNIHGHEIDYKQQVIAVGTALHTPHSPPGVNQGPVMLTSKNLQCMRCLLVLSHCYGSILGSAWQFVLTTLQHLVWILGLKPTTGGSLKAARPLSDPNAVITTAVIDDIPILSVMLSRLFGASLYLDEVSLHHMIDALCKLSREAMDVAISNREPSLFAVAKLLETGLVNLSRVDTFWRPLTGHLLEVCRHAHIRMREWGVEAITYLVKAALQFKYDSPLKENSRLQAVLLSPIVDLSSVPHGDVRQRQLECLLHILHNNGELLIHAWPFILDIISSISNQQSEHLIRLAFQCLQLVVADFLLLMPWKCLPICVDTTTKFGSQTQDLNISLTAIGLMWNIADYFYQNCDTASRNSSANKASFPEFHSTIEVPSFDKLWMCLYTKLRSLCVDPRPAVRKSSCQTLFSTISAHGSLLSPTTWKSVLWLVLFPLLDNVRDMSHKASDQKVDVGGSILIHHSRNTAQKQWAETQVQALSGVAKVFSTKFIVLKNTLPEFPKAWAILLNFIEISSLSGCNEVSLAALKSFQEILSFGEEGEEGEKCMVDGFASGSDDGKKKMWELAWDVWLRIAFGTFEKCGKKGEGRPTQAFLAALVQIFPYLFQHLSSSFSVEDMVQFCKIIDGAIFVPTFYDPMNFSLSQNPENAISPLQDNILSCFEMLTNDVLRSKTSMDKFVCIIFTQLLSLSKFSYELPDVLKKYNEEELLIHNYMPFGEKAIGAMVNLYLKTAEEDAVMRGNILEEILIVFDAPLSHRSDRVMFKTWKFVVDSFIKILCRGIPLARKHPDHFHTMWPQLATSLDHLLFPKMVPKGERGGDYTPDQFVEDEKIDCKIIEFIKTEVLSHSNYVPKQFILKIVVFLNKGSILSPSHNALIRRGSEVNLREEFAKLCFETLLQFSLLDGLDGSDSDISAAKDGVSNGALTGHLAVTALLFRFQEVLEEYLHDEEHSGNCPLPRHRLSEISFVMKAIATLIVSLKKTSDKVTRPVWDQLIKLYPYLVSCTITKSPQISASLREALQQYGDLLAPPASNVPVKISPDDTV